MMVWLGFVVDLVLKVLKSLIGMDKPAKTEVTHEKPKTPVDDRDDDDLLAELGLHHDRAKSGDAVRLGSSGQTTGSAGEQDG